MLLFRSEETVNGWCEKQGVPRRPILSLEQLWFLAVAWYANRLTVDSRRPAPNEMVAIFSKLGLEGSFWDPRADEWSSPPQRASMIETAGSWGILRIPPGGGKPGKG